MKAVEMDALVVRRDLLAVAEGARRLRETLVRHSDLRLGFIFPDGSSSETTELDLPDQAVHLFASILELLSCGKGVCLTVRRQEMTTEQAAAFLGVSRSVVRKEIGQGRIKFRMAGNRRMVDRDEALRYQRECNG